MNVGRKGMSWRATGSSLSQDEQQEERNQSFLIDSLKGKADGPAYVSHNVP